MHWVAHLFIYHLLDLSLLEPGCMFVLKKYLCVEIFHSQELFEGVKS